MTPLNLTDEEKKILTEIILSEIRKINELQDSQSMNPNEQDIAGNVVSKEKELMILNKIKDKLDKTYRENHTSYIRNNLDIINKVSLESGKILSKTFNIFNRNEDMDNYPNDIDYEELLFSDNKLLILTEKDHSNISDPINIFEYYGLEKQSYRNTLQEQKEMVNILKKEFGKEKAFQILEKFKINS